MGWPARLALVAPLLASASCSQGQHFTILDRDKVASVVVGQSSQADVLAILGQPAVKQLSLDGQTWIYDAVDRDGGTATGPGAGALPYPSFLGPGLGGSAAAIPPAQPSPPAFTLAVSFGFRDVVRDCSYSWSTFAAEPGDAALGVPNLAECGRPLGPSVTGP